MAVAALVAASASRIQSSPRTRIGGRCVKPSVRKRCTRPIRPARVKRKSIAVSIATISATTTTHGTTPCPNGPVIEVLLSHGVIVKPWKEAGYEHFIRVSIGSASDNAHFIKALTDALGAPA